MRYRFSILLFYGLSWLLPLFAQDEFKLAIEVRDKRTQRPILAIVSVVAIDSKNELKGKMVNEKYEISVKAGVQYRVFAASQEYKTYRQTHVFEKNSAQNPKVFLLDLEPLGDGTNTAVARSSLQKIRIIDRKQQNVLSQATVLIKDNTGQTIVPTKAADGTWLVELKESETYVVEVKAADYETYKNELRIEPNAPIEIALNLSVKNRFLFQAVDALTGKPVAARFKITDKVRETYSGTTNAEGSFYEITLPPQTQTYDLIATAAGYRTQQSTLVVNANLIADQTRRVLKLSKADISVKFQIRNAQTGQPLVANVRVIDQTDKRAILNVKNTPKGEAAVQINPERKYVLEVESAGFMPYQQPLEKAILQLETENSLIIKMNQIGDAFASLAAVDGATGKRIAAIFKISSNQDDEPTQSKTTEIALVAKFKISEPAIFTIETTAQGYRAHKGQLDAEEFNAGKVFTYEAVLTTEPKIEPKVEPKKAEKVAETPKVTPPTTPPPPLPAVVEKKLPASFVFSLRATDVQTNKIINGARFKIVNAGNRQPVVGKGNASNYQAQLQAAQGYLIEVEAFNYDKFLTKIELSDNPSPADLRREIKLIKKTANAKAKAAFVNDQVFENAKLGEAVTIEDNVYFDQSSYILRPEAHSQLNQLVVLMAKNTKLKVQIAGFTDNVGDPRLNLILSENRAKVIANYLVYKGITESRITHLGYGQTKPITPNDTEDNKRKNRRVEFIIKDN